MQAYMEGTGTSARALLARLRDETGHSMSDAMFSYILRGSRRMSRYHAVAFHAITGIDMADLTQWPKLPNDGKQLGDDRNVIQPKPKDSENVA